MRIAFVLVQVGMNRMTVLPVPFTLPEFGRVEEELLVTTDEELLVTVEEELLLPGPAPGCASASMVRARHKTSPLIRDLYHIPTAP
jgi:hypothetical protein